MNEIITMSHGSGGKQAGELIRKMFAANFGMNGPMTDSAVLESPGNTLAYTTDSYVVDPVFFPGGNIGKLAVCGTVNDLAVSGAEPRFISVSLIIEEGFSLRELGIIIRSMAEEAENAGVRIVTGDTKVVEKGKCDRIFINTSGIGIIKAGFEHISSGRNIRTGDRIIVNGPLGNHALAVMGARNSLSFATSLSSDCASLNRLTGKLLDSCKGIKFMRDLTRGGLAAVLNELSEMTHLGMEIDEMSIPLDDQVKGLCEMMGFDPLCLANEGKFIIVADPGEEDRILRILRDDHLGVEAKSIGHAGLKGENNYVTLNTTIGGKRIVDMPSGILLPRIC